MKVARVWYSNMVCVSDEARSGLLRYWVARAVMRALLVASLGCLPSTPHAAFAANTEPTLALMRATAVHSSSGRLTVILDGSFSFADALQLGLALDVQIAQGAYTAHCSLGGEVSVSVSGGSAQTAPAPCVLGVTDRTITLVLPAQFGPGDATAQLVLSHEGREIASNRLGFSL